MKYINFAQENQIVSGYPDGSFKPAQFITRAEVAKIIVKILDIK